MYGLINEIKNKTDELFYVKFDAKIVYGNKESILHFLINNLFNCTACLIDLQAFEQSLLKKVFIDINIVAKKLKTESPNPNPPTLLDYDYNLPIIELIKAVNNLKDLTLHQQEFLRNSI